MSERKDGKAQWGNCGLQTVLEPGRNAVRGSPEVPHCTWPSKGNLKQVTRERILKGEGSVGRIGVPVPASLCLDGEALSQEDLALTTDAKDPPPCTPGPLASVQL